MEAILKQINAVLGVTGSFVCLPNGDVPAQITLDKYDAATIASTARVATQTFHALASFDQQVTEADLVYGQGRVILKKLPNGILVILCARNINLPLLNLSVTNAVKQLPAAIDAFAPTAAPVPAQVAGKAAAAVATPAMSPLMAELEQEAHRLIDEGKHYRVRLRLMNDVAIWLTCPHHRNILVPLVRKHLEFGGFATEGESIEMLFEQLGYTSDRRYSAFYANKRFRLTDPKREFTADVFLDHFTLYQSVDLIPFLTQEEFRLPVTALTLGRLQLVDMSDTGLRDLSALVLEHDLSVGEEPGKIDAAYITRLCADDWGWFKTVSLNLDRITTFANANLAAADRALVNERAQRLKRNMDSTSKSLRWQTRARLGESVKWHETPAPYRATQSR